jgi:hypothetical protein
MIPGGTLTMRAGGPRTQLRTGMDRRSSAASRPICLCDRICHAVEALSPSLLYRNAER